MEDPFEQVRDSARKVHQQFWDDLRLGDARAAGMFGMLAGEMNAARKSLDLPPLPIKEEDGRIRPA